MANPILLFTSIWEEKAEDITRQILDTPKSEAIDIFLNSPGGSVSSGWAIIAAMNQHEANKNITVMGDASSMAFFMLLFADNVTANDASNFLIHRAASFWEELMDEDELKDVENRNKIIRKKLEARIDEDKFIEVTGKTFDDIFSMDDRLNVRLTAQQAKKIGLVDKIVKLDVKKRAEIESKYFNDIAALAEPVNSNNSNKNKMGKLADLIFGEKDPVLLAQIEETQFVYSKLEKGAKIKATGKDEKNPISGTFEADGKTITVVDNEITAVKDLDNKQKEIDALKAELKAFKEDQLTADEVAEVIIESNDKLNAKIKVLEDVLAKAKLTTSKVELPKGEFKNDKPAGDETSEKKRKRIQKAIDAKVAETTEAFSKSQNNRRV